MEMQRQIIRYSLLHSFPIYSIVYIQVTGRRDTYADNDLSDTMSGVYKPGSVLKYTCLPGHVVVPVLSATRVCRKGKWDGQPGTCVRKTPRFLPRGSCPPPPLINNGYYLSERSSGEKPYVLPVSGQYHQFEVGAIARSELINQDEDQQFETKINLNFHLIWKLIFNPNQLPTKIGQK